MASRQALTWLGHSSSEMIGLYHHLHDEECQQAMRALGGLTSAAEEVNETATKNGGWAARPATLISARAPPQTLRPRAV